MKRSILFLAAFGCGAPSQPSTGDDGTVVGGTDYNSDGAVPYMVSTHQPMNAGRTLRVTVYLPTTPGKHPVVSLSCGSTQTAAGYETYGKRLASHGIAAVMTDDPGALTNTVEVVSNAAYI